MSYYHAFKIGFNFWMLLIPAFIVTSAVVGWNNIYIKKHKIRRRFNDRFYMLLACTAGVVTIISLFIESFSGIIQMFDNIFSKSGDSPVWSVVMAPIAIFSVAFAVTAVCFFVNGAAERLHRNRLHSTNRPAR